MCEKQKFFFIAGNPVLHSMSPVLFSAHCADAARNYIYARALCSEVSDIELLLNNGFFGGNVTAPLKEEVLKTGFAKSLQVEQTKAANTIWRNEGEFFLENTDIDGVQTALNRHCKVLSGQKAVVAGIGGAARAAVFALKQMGLDVNIANRSVDKAQFWAEQFACSFSPLSSSEASIAEAQVFVNTIGSNYVFFDGLHNQLTVLDADYNNNVLKDECEKRGATYISGLQWLIYQAIPAYMHLTSSSVSENVLIEAIQNRPKINTSNIFLSGMMKTGKSTLAPLLAQRLGYDFVDTDSLVEQLAGKTVNEIFESEGEVEFRSYEKQVMEKLSGFTKMVVATGGGVVLDDENKELIRNNGLGICLFASPKVLASRLDCESRPLLSGFINEEKRLKELLHRRFSDYLLGSQIVVPVDGKHPESLSQLIYNELLPYIK
jgi:shikimate dehydrogenase